MKDKKIEEELFRMVEKSKWDDLYKWYVKNKPNSPLRDIAYKVKVDLIDKK